MRLETQFVKLPLLFDVERLREEIAQFSEDEWMGHTTGFAGNTAIPLISLDGEFNDAMHGPMKPTPALGRCPYIQQIMTTFGEVFGRSRLMRVAPGHTVPPHVDVNYHWFNRVRIHIPITTTPDVLFHCGGKHVHMAPGEAWLFNSWMEHTVENNSDAMRVHLVLDASGSPRFWDLVEQGEWPFADRPDPPAEPQFVRFDPALPTQVRTERYNTPVVHSPGELEHLIRALADDVVCSNESETAGRQAFIDAARRFIQAWREVWSEHGMQASGWPHYHRLTYEVDAAVVAIPAELALKSGVDLVHAFRGLVLSSAINEEIAPLYLESEDVPDKLQRTTRSYAPAPAKSSDKTSSDKTSSDKTGSDKTPRNAPCPCG
ncbi:MAG: aspartyl/asparaginyl beta-hydroxylase domain-containing protein, partial [Xanthomonadales bacterium]|nr:aspartyl/asparaginyl beta-hydroxylase domain-containing protein [Xanthomonadales bacterium]